MTVLGLDGCKGGWAAVAIDDEGLVGSFVAASIADVEAEANARWNVATIVVDIPIGLPDRGPRQADIEARKFIGPRRNSVFPTPVRNAVESSTYLEASAASIAASGKSLSKQAWAITPKIREVDAHIKSGDASARILEGHPEVSFRAMAGESIDHYKKSLSGLLLRRELLASEGVAFPEGIERELKGCDLDDLHDAAAMAWTARRVERGEVDSKPNAPEVFSDGLPSAIWY
ncbi:DUF429 domain-containing protein [uncultured Demequina sp.]|uniref:DUF429 domain-containing protein n=1 Tax=uncultured Demequina sp. TaxID=693499 RepID=UPI0025F41880|nr:DUF429 domain-containing protein [uncultured Demequina sp.]